MQLHCYLYMDYTLSILFHTLIQAHSQEHRESLGHGFNCSMFQAHTCTHVVINITREGDAVRYKALAPSSVSIIEVPIMMCNEV